MGARFSTSIDMADTAEAIVQRVEAFNWRDYKDSENWKMKAHMGIDPMLLALAMELALKAWFVFDFDDKKVKQTHELVKLFKKLSPESQEKLDTEFKNSVAPLHPNFLHINYGIRDVFYKHDKAFIEWRYLYEPKEKGLSFDQSVFIATLKMVLAEFRKRYRTVHHPAPGHFR